MPRPADDQRIAGAAIAAVDRFGPGKGRIARDSPAGGVMIEPQRTTELVDVFHYLRNGLGHGIENGILVEDPVHAALGARPVVADDVKDQSIVELPQITD